MGPVEYIVIGFPGNRFNGEIVPALEELVQSGTVNILDLIFVHKDEYGNVTAIEMEEEPDAPAFEGLEGEVGGLLSEGDFEAIGEQIPLNTSAALLVWENAWAERFAAAVRGSGGQVLANQRIPYDVVQAALAYISGEAA